MTDLFTAIPAQPQRIATLSDYLVDLFVARLSDAQLGARRKAGEYDRLRAQDVVGYHKLARGRRS